MNSPNSSNPQSGKSIFNRKAQEKLRGVDDLQKGLHVVRIRGWAVVASLIVLFLGLAAWGFFGMVSSSLSTKSVAELDEVNNEVIVSCLVLPEEADLIKVGDNALLMGQKSKVTGISSVPLSENEVRAELDSSGLDYLANTLVRDEWMYAVSFDLEQVDTSALTVGTAIDTVILYERVTPIQQLLRGLPW